MLMVIFGAGASYDSAPAFPADDTGHASRSDRPPLTDQLFDERFAKLLERYPDCLSVVPRLRQRDQGTSLEQVLERLRAQAEEGDRTRLCQLTAVRFYLQQLLLSCERKWHTAVTRGVTNHKTLLDDIRNLRSLPACLVTFNYDLMIESALESPPHNLRIREMEDYIRDEWKLFKLHGSVDWRREVHTTMDSLAREAGSEVVQEMIARAPELDVSTTYRRVIDGDQAWSAVVPRGRVALFPAIAIPVTTKALFECPENHVSAFQEILPRVTKIVIIGWRGTEAHFLRLLKDGLRRAGVRTMIVAGSIESAEEVARRLRGSNVEAAVDPVISEGGFTHGVLSNQILEFLGE